MSYRFVQIPREMPVAHYEEAIERMTKKLSACPGVISVSQVGGIGSAGISDIDFFVVFKDDFSYEVNPVEGLSADDRYLFTHNLFGTSQKFASRMEQYTYFGSYKNLYGEAIVFQQDLDPAGIEIMNHQIAKEYLLKAWLTISIEKKSGVIKIRNLFLLAKALMHDLALLHISSGSLWDVIREIIQTRNNWFVRPAGEGELAALVDRYECELFNFLKEELTGNFWLSEKRAIPISRNIFIQRGNELRLRSLGLMLPAVIRMKLPKGESLQRRLVKFTAEVPASKSAIPASVSGRHQWISEAVQYNNSHLPGFVPTAYGLSIFNTPM